MKRANVSTLRIFRKEIGKEFEFVQNISDIGLPIPQYLPSIAHNQKTKEKGKKREREETLGSVPKRKSGSASSNRGLEKERAIIGEERRGNERIGDKIGGQSRSGEHRHEPLSIKPPFHVPVRAHSLERDYARLGVHDGDTSWACVRPLCIHRRVFVHATYLLACGFLSGHGS